MIFRKPLMIVVPPDKFAIIQTDFALIIEEMRKFPEINFKDFQVNYCLGEFSKIY